MKKENFERAVKLSDELRHYTHISRVLRLGCNVDLQCPQVDPVMLTVDDLKMFHSIVLEKIQDIEKQIQDL